MPKDKKTNHEEKGGEIKPLFPMRINKYLASLKYTTRRGADKLIEKKSVFINGRLATLGDKVNEGDKIEFKHKIAPKEFSYFAYNKPVGIATHASYEDEMDIAKSINIQGEHVFPIGRLDKESSGLIILTDDGRITGPLLDGEYEHEKEYIVTTKEKLRSSFKRKMESGVDIEGYVTKNCKVKILGENKFSIILTEGKKHQIRRMCANLFQEVDTLKRVRILNIELGKLSEGGHRRITGEELEIFLTSLGIKR